MSNQKDLNAKTSFIQNDCITTTMQIDFCENAVEYLNIGNLNESLTLKIYNWKSRYHFFENQSVKQ